MSQLSSIRGMMRKVNVNASVIKFIYARSETEYELFKEAMAVSDDDVTLVVFKHYEVFKE